MAKQKRAKTARRASFAVVDADPLSFSVPIQKGIADLDPELPVSDVLTIEQIIERSLGNASLSAQMNCRCLLFYIFREPVILEIPLFGHGNRSLNFRVADNT